uniref:Dihydrodipicolinate reductase N-terminal domain-containing protein n=1 Tax=Ananas comosus var. bracteatus TaxID=296719 RepID=A0A6V7PXE5_ANACO|nr:unnamed protein product [Ananas comosus var. bracteatus]
MQPSQNNIKVVINGATKEIGRAAILAVTKARGMEVAAAVDNQLVGQDAGKISGMEEPLEIPVLNDLTMVLGSIAQSRATGVVVDFTEPSTVYDNVKQAAAFGLSSIVYVPKIQLETVTELSLFCEKASMGCLIAPTLSIGSVLLQQAAIQASFHYNNVEIVESRPDPAVYTLKHDVTNVKCLMPEFDLWTREVLVAIMQCNEKHWDFSPDRSQPGESTREQFCGISIGYFQTLSQLPFKDAA